MYLNLRNFYTFAYQKVLRHTLLLLVFKIAESLHCVLQSNFQDQDAPYDKYCNATAVLKIEYVYKQSKNHHLQVYAEQGKHNDAERQICSKLGSSDDDDVYFEV